MLLPVGYSAHTVSTDSSITFSHVTVLLNKTIIIGNKIIYQYSEYAAIIEPNHCIPFWLAWLVVGYCSGLKEMPHLSYQHLQTNTIYLFSSVDKSRFQCKIIQRNKLIFLILYDLMIREISCMPTWSICYILLILGYQLKFQDKLWRGACTINAHITHMSLLESELS